MGKNIVFYDVDGTLTYDHVSFGFANELSRKKSIEPDAYARIKEIEFKHSKNEIPQDAAVEQYGILLSQGLKGYRVPPVRKIARQLAGRVKIRKVLEKEIRELGDMGYPTAVISGVPEILLGELAARLGVTYFNGADLPSRNGRFTGGKPRWNMTADEKERIVLRYIGRGFVPFRAYGDSMGDRDILKHALHPVAVNPRDELAAEAKSRGWTIWRDGEKFTSVTEMIKRETAEA